MKPKRLERVARLVEELAAEAQSRLPACCLVSADDMFPAVLPLALRLEWLEHRYRKDAKAARRYRRLMRRTRREVAAMLAGRDGGLAPPDALRNALPFDPAMWHVALVDGAPAWDPADREAA